MRLRPAARRPGITLLEVLGATAIFLMSIVAIGELMSSSTDQALEVQFRSRATRLCQSKLNEFAAGVEQLSGATEGDFEEEGWSWKAEVTPDGSAANLYKVQVTVSRDTSRGPVEVTMAQFVFDPLQRGQLTASTTDTSGSGSGTGSGTSGSGSGPAAGGSSGAAAGAGSGGSGRGGAGTGGGTGGGGRGGGAGTGGGGAGGGGRGGGAGAGAGGGTGGGGRGGGGSGGGRGGP
jgi:type II secretory pathway pseudopilin PulG